MSGKNQATLLSLILMVLLFIQIAVAQVVNFNSIVHRPSSFEAALNIPLIRLPRQDSSQLRFLAEMESSLMPFKFGEHVSLNFDLLTQPSFVTTAANGQVGKVFRAKVESFGATTLSLFFNDFFLPSGAELYAVGEKETVGPFTDSNNNDDRHFAIWPLEGSTLILELWLPLEIDQNDVAIRIDGAVHGFRDLRSSGSCNLDALCNNFTIPWEKEIRSVALMLTDRGTRYCTGAMINNIENDGRQLFLSAAHCIMQHNDRHGLLFNYQRKVCGSATDGTSKNTVFGLKQLAYNTESDFVLFEVVETIPASYNVFMSGFNAQEDPIPKFLVGIHHPSGDVKKLSFFNGTVKKDCWAGACGSRGPDHWEIRPWTLGTTEPGSSGSPLFNEKHQIVGQLHGGTASCFNKRGYDRYGGLFASWDWDNTPKTRIKDYLDPKSTGKLQNSGNDLNKLRSKLRFVRQRV